MAGIFVAQPGPTREALLVFAATIRADYLAGGHIVRADVKAALDALDKKTGVP